MKLPNTSFSLSVIIQLLNAIRVFSTSQQFCSFVVIEFENCSRTAVETKSFAFNSKTDNEMLMARENLNFDSGKSVNGNSQNAPTLMKSSATASPKQKYNALYGPVVHTANRPPYSFSSLIFMAIENSPEKALSVKEICSWIVQNFPYFKTAPTNWKGTVRRALSKSFFKVEKSPDMLGGSLWSVEQQQRDNLLQALARSHFQQWSDYVRLAPYKTNSGATPVCESYIRGSEVTSAIYTSDINNCAQLPTAIRVLPTRSQEPQQFYSSAVIESGNCHRISVESDSFAFNNKNDNEDELMTCESLDSDSPAAMVNDESINGNNQKAQSSMTSSADASPKQTHHTHVQYDPMVHTTSKPPYSYSSLIFLAIEDSPEKALLVKDIYAWIVQHFPYFKTAPTNWKNTVSRTLSSDKSFFKVERAPNILEKSSWRVEQQQRPNLLQALARSHFQQLSAVEKFDLYNTNPTILDNPPPTLDPALSPKLW